MAEYIEREAIAKLFDSECRGECVVCPHDDRGDCTLMNQIPAADVQPVTWIPVTERLPEEFGRYLCRYRVEDNETIGYCTDFGRYDPEHGEWYANTVTHWMPLPEPPKDGEP